MGLLQVGIYVSQASGPGAVITMFLPMQIYEPEFQAAPPGRTVNWMTFATAG
jgi:hypothetical protein